MLPFGNNCPNNESLYFPHLEYFPNFVLKDKCPSYLHDNPVKGKWNVFRMGSNVAHHITAGHGILILQIIQLTNNDSMLIFHSKPSISCSILGQLYNI